MPDDLPRIHKKRRPRNKPRDDSWLQQNLAAYRPVYTFRCALPGLLIYSFLCVGASIALYKNSEKAFEHIIDYTDCKENPHMMRVEEVNGTHRYCKYTFWLPDVEGKVLFYYGLRNFYQNIRKYEQSRNDKQLAGKLTYTDECYPFETTNKTSDGTKYPIVPCGSVANSMFNDTFNLTYFYNGIKLTPVPLTADGLLHPRFRNEKYKNPVKCTNEDDSCPGFENTAKPSWWSKRIEELGDQDTGRALENFDFIQWMETSALPNFRKLYRKLDQLPGSIFSDGLPAGNYCLFVDYNYNVSEWGGSKLFVIQVDGPMGPKAMFQVYAFFALGLFLFIFSFFMALVEFTPCLKDVFQSFWERVQPPELDGI